MGIGDNIRQYRKAAGLSRDNLAERLHVDENDVALWERGIKSPEETLLYRIAESLNISPDVLRDSVPAQSAAPNEAESAESARIQAADTESEVALKLVTPLETSLRHGEKLIWAGKPVRRRGLKAFTQPQTLLKAGGLLIELIFLFNFARMSPLFVAAAIAVTAVQLMLALRRMRRTARLREGTHYAITDERVIIRHAYMDEGVQYLELGEIRSVQCDESSGGVGSILFLNEEMAELNTALPSVPLAGALRYAAEHNAPQYGFFDIADVEKVYNIVRNLLN